MKTKSVGRVSLLNMQIKQVTGFGTTNRLGTGCGLWCLEAQDKGFD